MDTVRLKHISPSVLRIGIAAVFLWFGMSQVMDPAAWAGFVPDYVMAFTGIAVGTVVYWNGMFEIVFGSLLFFELFLQGFKRFKFLINRALLIKGVWNRQMPVLDLGPYTGNKTRDHIGRNRRPKISVGIVRNPCDADIFLAISLRAVNKRPIVHGQIGRFRDTIVFP